MDWLTKQRILKLVLGSILLVCLIQTVSAATVLVAASDSSATTKSQAKYVCDGVADQSEIQAALNDAGAGGVVELSEGTFHTSGSIVIPAQRTLTGRGEETTVLDMSGWGYIYMERYGRNVQHNAFISVSNENTVLKKFTITGYGWILITASNSKVEDVTVRDSFNQPQPGDYRIGSAAAFSVQLMNKNLKNIEFIRCKAIRVGTDGFENDNMDDPNQDLGGHPQYFLENVKYIDCQAITCGSGVYPDPNQGSRAREIFACGFDVQEYLQIKGMMLQNCYAEDNWMDGIHMEARNAFDVTIDNCKVIKNGLRKLAKWGSSNAGRGIQGARNTVISNCYSENNANVGYNIICSWHTRVVNCVDVGSPIGFMCNGLNLPDAYSDNTFTDCISRNAKKYGFYFTNTVNCRLYNCRVENANGDGTYLNYQSNARSCLFEIVAVGGKSPQIINTGGTNTFDCTWGSSEPTEPSEPLKGDLNDNGVVDVGDVTYVTYMVSGKASPDLRADFNNNGIVDIGDAAKIKYYYLGLINSL